jgi:hypothetical protein
LGSESSSGFALSYDLPITGDLFSARAALAFAFRESIQLVGFVSESAALAFAFSESIQLIVFDAVVGVAGLCAGTGTTGVGVT